MVGDLSGTDSGRGFEWEVAVTVVVTVVVTIATTTTVFKDFRYGIAGRWVAVTVVGDLSGRWQ